MSLAILETSTLAYLSAIALIILFGAHAVWLSLFALDLLYDTSRTTAAERARNIVRFLAYGLSIEFLIGVFVLVLWAIARSSA